MIDVPFIIETLVPAIDDIFCEWQVKDGETKFVCVDETYSPVDFIVSWFFPYTFMVLAETDEERMTRIALAADEHVVGTVKRWKEECDSFLAGGPEVMGATDVFEEEDCNMIVEVYDAGFTVPLSDIDDSRLLEFKAGDPGDGYDGRMYNVKNKKGERAGKIIINIESIEASWHRPSSRGLREETTRKVIAHERVHLADWLDNGQWDWMDLPYWFHKYGRTDDTYKWGWFIGEQAGSFPLHWERACSNDDHQVEYFLAGWGHHNEVRDGFCIVKRVLTGGR